MRRPGAVSSDLVLNLEAGSLNRLTSSGRRPSVASPLNLFRLKLPFLAAALLLMAASACPAAVIFQETGREIVVTAGLNRYVVSKRNCTVFDRVTVDGVSVASGGEISYRAADDRLFLGGAPVKTLVQKDFNRIYQEGWFQHKQKREFLYYIIRYQFYEQAPYVKLVLTFTDRHEQKKTEAQWDPFWNSQGLSKIKVALNVPALTRQVAVEQHNAFDYRKTDERGQKPYFILEEKKGSPSIFTEHRSNGTAGRRQIQHLSNSSQNWIRFFPLLRGRNRVALTWDEKTFPDHSAYKRGKGIVARVRHAQGESRVSFDQVKSGRQDLGSYSFDETSYIDVTGEREAGVLLLESIEVGKESIKLFNRHEDFLSDGPFTLLVKDFWRNYPISMELEKGRATVEFIKEPAVFMGGMGKTFEIMYCFGDSSAAKKTLYAPPAIGNTNIFSDFLYFSLKGNKEYEKLADQVRHGLLPHLESQRSLGWRNWGDYQIGVSYDQTEDWGNLQYDLPYGLLVLYIRTRDPELWKLAQASIYHMMDLDLVKFSPFAPKYNGSLHRKGEMPRHSAHVASEPIVPQNFAFRGLFLYYLLTGDLFAYDCAKMSVANLAEFTVSESRLDFASHGDRDTAWILLGLLFGYEKFGQVEYLAKAGKVVDRLLRKQDALGRLPGLQPVWQGQTVEALIKYYEITRNPRVRDAIIKHVRWLRDHAIESNPGSGRLKMIYMLKDREFIPVNPTWTDESNYFFLHLNSFRYAYDLTRDPSFKKMADAMFRQAFNDHKRFLGPRQASSFLSFPFYYLEKAGDP